MVTETRTELGALWKLALPLALAQAGGACMGMVDTAVVGRLSAAAQGGAGLANSLVFTITFMGMGVMMGLDPLISQAIGAGRHGRARALFWAGLWLAGMTSVGVMALIACVPSILVPFGVKQSIAAGAAEFIWWRLPGVPATLFFIGSRAYLQAIGRAQVMLWATVVANIANLCFDLVFVFGAGPLPAMGIAGAALSTTLCSWLQFGILMYAVRAPAGDALEQVSRRFDWVSVKQAGSIGLPIGLHLIAEAAIFSLVGLFAGTLGEASAAAHQVALSWASMSFCVAVGIGSAGSVRVGLAVGRHDTPGARRSGLLAFGSGVLFMGCSALLFIAIPGPLARAMSSQPEVVAVTASLLWVVAIFQISDGMQAIGAGVLRGAGDTRFVFWANIVGHWLIGLPVAYWFGIRLSVGVVGLWWGLCAGLTAVGVTLLLRFAALSGKEIAPLSQESAKTR